MGFLYSVDHCVGVARDLADRLNIRLNNQTAGGALNFVRQTQDEYGYPILVVSHGGTETEGNPVVWIRITNLFEPIAGVSPAGSPVDVFGNATLPFTPSITQIAYELTSGGAPEPTVTDYSTCLFEIARTGTVVQEYAIANGTAVTEAAVNAATPLITLKDIDWGFKGNT
jgi:hypothetical protein